MDTVFARLRALGDDFTPEQITATRELFAPRVPKPEDAGAQVQRDLRYGPDARNRLDVFTTRGGQPRAVVVFVHGGGFVQGDKGDAGAPFFNNFGAWAVREGFVGVTLTYRLAPANTWPSGGEDLERAIDWLVEHVADHGGDPARIVLTGQSAGATHVASYLAGQGATGSGAPRVAAAALFSGVFDLEIADRNGPNTAYYGTDYTRYAERSTVGVVGSTGVPCLFTVSEFDPPQFHRQAAAVVNARLAQTGRCPELVWLAGHNHVSSVMQIGSPVDTLGPVLAAFVRRVTEQTG